jgi:flagellar assembly factor FliW
MQITTTRFGVVEIRADDILIFPFGIIGFEAHRHWVLMDDMANPAVGWLQSLSHPDVAIAVVSPRRFVNDFQVRTSRQQLGCLNLNTPDQAFVLAVVSKNNGLFTLNLRAPIIINLDRKLGRQVVVNDDLPLQFHLSQPVIQLRKSA